MLSTIYGCYIARLFLYSTQNVKLGSHIIRSCNKYQIATTIEYLVYDKSMATYVNLQFRRKNCKRSKILIGSKGLFYILVYHMQIPNITMPLRT